jgi:hypothetical protein
MRKGNLGPAACQPVQAGNRATAREVLQAVLNQKKKARPSYDEAEVASTIRDLFSDVCEKQFSSLAANRERISRYLTEALSGA